MTAKWSGRDPFGGKSDLAHQLIHAGLSNHRFHGMAMQACSRQRRMG